ncbi:MAG: PAS domain-containing protein, partial [Thiotrichaceae bacterium]|nr:PAS domain-containing protein [Thiotrichaceae bacterium]
MLKTKLINDKNLLTSHPLFEQWAEGLLVVDTNGYIINVNNTAIEILGYERNDLEGQILHSLLCGQAADFQHKAENCPFNDIKIKLQANHIVDAWF